MLRYWLTVLVEAWKRTVHAMALGTWTQVIVRWSVFIVAALSLAWLGTLGQVADTLTGAVAIGIAAVVVFAVLLLGFMIAVPYEMHRNATAEVGLLKGALAAPNNLREAGRHFRAMWKEGDALRRVRRDEVWRAAVDDWFTRLHADGEAMLPEAIWFMIESYSDRPRASHADKIVQLILEAKLGKLRLVVDRLLQAPSNQVSHDDTR